VKYRVSVYFAPDWRWNPSENSGPDNSHLGGLGERNIGMSLFALFGFVWVVDGVKYRGPLNCTDGAASTEISPGRNFHSGVWVCALSRLELGQDGALEFREISVSVILRSSIFGPVICTAIRLFWGTLAEGGMAPELYL
jgi:hypothetical protein